VTGGVIDVVVDGFVDVVVGGGYRYFIALISSVPKVLASSLYQGYIVAFRSRECESPNECPISCTKIAKSL